MEKFEYCESQRWGNSLKTEVHYFHRFLVEYACITVSFKVTCIEMGEKVSTKFFLFLARSISYYLLFFLISELDPGGFIIARS